MAELAHSPLCTTSCCVPKLLVSVRNADEARMAVECGVDLVDIKEPRHGALGASPPETVRAVARQVGAARPISVALGELLGNQVHNYREVLHREPVEFAKIGLAGAGGLPRWWRHWHRMWAALPCRTRRVGVVYADWQDARAPSPLDALDVFAEQGCAAVLFDTYQKDGRSLLDHARSDELAKWMEKARAAAPLLVLAGSLSCGALAGLPAFRPDYVAIRGAACEGGRLGRITERRLLQFADALRHVFDPYAKTDGAVKTLLR